MMSQHFRLSSELTRAIAKRIARAKNQLSVSGNFFNQFVTDIYIYIYKRSSLGCAVRLANTVSAGGALWASGVTLIIYKGNNISKYVCPTVIMISHEKSQNLSIFKILMSNDDVITK